MKVKGKENVSLTLWKIKKDLLSSFYNVFTNIIRNITFHIRRYSQCCAILNVKVLITSKIIFFRHHEQKLQFIPTFIGFKFKCSEYSQSRKIISKPIWIYSNKSSASGSVTNPPNGVISDKKANRVWSVQYSREYVVLLNWNILKMNCELASIATNCIT